MRSPRPTAAHLAALAAPAVLALLLLLAAAPAGASFHLMQIEQVAGGFCGDRTAQAVQLRMRAAGQNLVDGTQLLAFDATGANPVTLIVFPSDVANAVSGSRILAVTPSFATRAHVASPDFTLSAPIPVSYLQAGRVTFGGGGLMYWSLAWGGTGYTGPNTGQTDNDADGNFGPPVAGVLPTRGDTALRFQGTAGAMSTTNAADYAVSASPATWTNNAGTATAADTCLFYDGFESGDLSAWSASVP
jgi:hypothetical protein